MKSATQSDIAKALGVSVSTVALVVGNASSANRKFVNNETAKRIRQKAAELGYRPNLAASRLRKGRSNLVVFLHMGGLSELVGQRVQEVGRFVHQNNYDFLTIDAYWWIGEAAKLIDRVLSLRPEGVIISGSLQVSDFDFSIFQKLNIPIVTIDLVLPGFSCVRHDCKGAIAELTRAALSRTPKQTALLLFEAPDNDTWQRKERLAGFKEAVKQSGLGEPKSVELLESPSFTMEPVLHPTLIYYPSKWISCGAFAQGQQIATRVGRAARTLICFNDHVAFGAVSHYVRAGIRMPEEISLTGFDNLSFSAEGLVPLTTVQLPTELMCHTAVELLFERLKKRNLPSAEVVHPCRIVWRNSMLPPTP